jgi:hypothetical protein
VNLIKAKQLHQAHRIRELSEGLASKRGMKKLACHLNQVHHQYVDSSGLIEISSYSPSNTSHYTDQQENCKSHPLISAIPNSKL